uniref:Cullin N-terminal domain-containing protein n=1 Tax=Attheya septentrionalis TaxID=420275 RepID=A0A7S2XIM0_9STRA
MHLDRLLVYLPAQDEVVLRSGMSGTTSNITSRPFGDSNPAAGGVGGNANVTSKTNSNSSGPAWSLWEVGLAALRRHMEQHNMMEPVLVASMVQSLLLELDDWTTDVSLMKQSIRMLLELDLYTDLFLPTLEQNVSVYLQTECQRWINNDEHNNNNDGDDALMDIPAFLRHVDRRLRQCNDMALLYLQSSASSMTLSVGLGLLDDSSSSSSSSTPMPTNQSRHRHRRQVSKNRILTTLVDTHLLAPHVTPLATSCDTTAAAAAAKFFHALMRGLLSTAGSNRRIPSK